jgi:ABC-type transporter Mla MlaB component
VIQEKPVPGIDKESPGKGKFPVRIFGKNIELPFKKRESEADNGKAGNTRPAVPNSSLPKPASSGGKSDETALADEEASLDFSAYAPPPKSEPPRVRPPFAQAAPPADQHKIASAASASMSSALPSALSQPGKVSAVAPAMPASAAAVQTLAPLRQPPAGPGFGRGPDSNTRIAETAKTGDATPGTTKAAILFANGQVDQALVILSRSVLEGDPGDSAQQEWLMLFDLYQHLGMREEFEALSLKFAVKFERSPPVWTGSERQADPALATGGSGYCALTGTLSEASVPEFEKLKAAAEGRQSVRVDCRKLQGVDAAGCRQFREVLHSIRGAGKEIMFTGEAQILQSLEEMCRPGKAETDRAIWELLIDVYRLLGPKDKFEEAAINYAVTFEVSPPSWETGTDAGPERTDKVRSDEASDPALALSGELIGAGEALAMQLQDWAASNQMMVIDMTRVKRVDFITAGLMLKVLAKLHQAGTTIQIRGANELIQALFRVVGIGAVARIFPRK